MQVGKFGFALDRDQFGLRYPSGQGKFICGRIRVPTHSDAAYAAKCQAPGSSHVHLRPPEPDTASGDFRSMKSRAIASKDLKRPDRRLVLALAQSMACGAIPSSSTDLKLMHRMTMLTTFVDRAGFTQQLAWARN